MDLRYTDPQARVLNYFYTSNKSNHQSISWKFSCCLPSPTWWYFRKKNFSPKRSSTNGMTSRNPKENLRKESWQSGTTKWHKLAQDWVRSTSGTRRSGSSYLRGTCGTRRSGSSDRRGTSRTRTGVSPSEPLHCSKVGLQRPCNLFPTRHFYFRFKEDIFATYQILRVMQHIIRESIKTLHLRVYIHRSLEIWKSKLIVCIKM